MKLYPNQISAIKKIILDEFEMTPYRRVATKLVKAGFNSEHLRAFGNTKTGKAINSACVWNTYNEIKNIED